MFSFQQELENSINNQIIKFLKCISSNYNISFNDLLNIWKNNGKNEKNILEEEKKEEKKEEVKKEEKKEVKNNNVKDILVKYCPYVFKRGKNKGKKCGAKCAKNSMYCSKHKKYENKEPKIKKKKLPPKPVVKKTIIRKNKQINKFWHPETKLVFKSKNERIVIGKCNEDNDIIKLTKEDIEL